ncbi:MAG: hypothetical protein Q9M30_00585, partial [Mariprofundaceae bacterium]|nr:hypothetical protein [Mariprofundaceae bacterium]
MEIAGLMLPKFLRMRFTEVCFAIITSPKVSEMRKGQAPAAFAAGVLPSYYQCFNKKSSAYLSST